MDKKNEYALMIKKFSGDVRVFYKQLQTWCDFLETHVWLKNNQFNEKVSDYDFILKATVIFTDELLTNPDIYDGYIINAVKKLDERYFEYVHTNMVTINPTEAIKEAWSNNEKITPENVDSIIDNLKGPIFHRVIYVVGKKDDDLFFSPIKHYTLPELESMITSKKIVPLYQIWEDEGITMNETFKMARRKEIDYKQTGDHIGSFLIDDFGDAKTSYEKNRWITRNISYVRYLRNHYIDFSLHQQNFDSLVNYVKNVMLSVSKEVQYKDNNTLHLQVINHYLSKINNLEKQMQEKQDDNNNEF